MKTEAAPSSSPDLTLVTSSGSSSSSEASLADSQFKSQQHSQFALRRMESYYLRGQLCDVTLIAGTKRIRAHRIVLSAASDYFTAMFTTPVVESKQEEIEMKVMDPEALAAVIGYCYSGKIELSEETVEPILITAHHLLLSEVTDACCQFLIKQLHPANTLGIQLFAERLGCSTLNQLATKYTESHFMEVVQHQEFLQLPKPEISSLLSSDCINVPTEETAFKALMLWLNHDFDSRKKYLGELLAFVRLPLLSAKFLADSVEPNPLLREDRICRDLIMEAMKYHLLPQRQSELLIGRTDPRKSTVGKFYIVGGMHADKSSPYTIERYDLLSNSWMSLTTMKGRRLQIGVAVKEKKIFIAGGRDGLKTLNTFECYDPKSHVWTTLSPMSNHRHGLGVGVLEGPLYAVGGHDGWSYLNTVERWDPQSKQWSFVASMVAQRCTVGVAVLAGRLYAVGGRDGSSCLKTVESYDPHTNRWSACAPMNVRRGGVAVVTSNGFLYAMGGNEALASNPTPRLDSVERYDPVTDTWTEVASMIVGCDSAGGGVLGGKIYCVGGYDGQHYLKTAQCYDPQTNEWTKVADLFPGRAGACGAVIEGCD